DLTDGNTNKALLNGSNPLIQNPTYYPSSSIYFDCVFGHSIVSTETINIS
ncbi:19581_t:CDS:1, partial [Gigaspora rosea]